MANIFDIDGNVITTDDGIKLCGVILDATTKESRFLAMKQLFDIAKKVIADPSYVPSDTEFTYASKGCVCVLPPDSTAFYEQYPLTLLYAKNEEVQTIPASTTKVMAIVTALPYIKSIKDKVTIESEDIQTGSGNFFEAGDTMTFEDLLFGMLLPSSNTCAWALAHNVGKVILGNNSASTSDCVSAFVAEMNRRSGLIGCTNSIWTSSSGLPATRSTAKDLMRVLLEACSCPEILRIWNKKTYTIEVEGTNARSVELTSTVTNSTLEEDYYIFGGKTGFIISPEAAALVMVAGIK